MTTEKSPVGWYFFLIALAIYLITAVIDPAKAITSIAFSFSIITNIILPIIIVIIIMSLVNYFINPQSLSKTMGKTSGIKKWLIAIVGGIISTGPIYLWYPLLKELKNKGLGYGIISTFLYNRAIKIPLLPVLAVYFSLTFVLVLTIIMIIASIFQGIIIDKLEEGKII